VAGTVEVDMLGTLRRAAPSRGHRVRTRFTRKDAGPGQARGGRADIAETDESVIRQAHTDCNVAPQQTLTIEHGEGVVNGLMGIRDELGIPNACPASPDDLAIVPMAERA